MVNQKKEPPKNEPELYPDAWDRFQQAVHVMAKAGPQHRVGGAAVKSGPKHKIAKKKATVKPTKGVISKKPLVNG